MILSVITLIVVLLTIVFLSISFYITIFCGAPFVPTPKNAVLKMLKLAKIKKGETLIDIGSGDGRFLHYASKLYKANSIGFELDPFVYMLARFKQIFFGWEGKIIRGNLLNHSISKADILICYLLPKSLKKFQKKFDKELKKGTRIISYTFHIGDWKPEKTIPKEGNIKTIYIYKKS
jgi:hypothetical protein